MDSSATNWLTRLKTDLQRDKKKTALLLVLLAAAGIIGGRLVLARPAAKSASASGTGALPAEPAGPTASVAPAPAGHVGDSRKEEHLARLNRSIVRDLFRANPEFFPPEQGFTSVQVTEEPKDALGWLAQVRQTMTGGEEYSRQRKARTDAVRVEAQVLDLQTTMLGDSPTAMINGRLLREGDVISGFVLKRVGSSSCVVTKDGVEITLKMKG